MRFDAADVGLAMLVALVAGVMLGFAAGGYSRMEVHRAEVRHLGRCPIVDE